MSEQRRLWWLLYSLLVASSPIPGSCDCCWSEELGEVLVVGENHCETREVTRFKIDCKEGKG